jgi:acyl-CoA synthetase (AMP-forming)/AMP-acid ligase II
MIYSRLVDLAQERPAREFVIADGRAYSYDEALAQAKRLARQLKETEKGRWLVYMRDSARLVFLILALDAVCSEFSILSHSATESEIELISQRLSMTDVLIDRVGLDLERVDQVHLREISDESEAFASHSVANDNCQSTVIILTTGTTGVPKGAEYKWSRLAKRIKIRPRLDGSRWLLTYHLNHFAGLQVFLYTLLNGGTLVIPESRDVRSVLNAIKTHQVGYVSGTPTFWRMFVGMLRDNEVYQIALKHITIGGEAVTDDLLERIHHLFPEVSVSQMYVTTELGVCFTVRDGRKGFPVSFLDDPELPVQLKIEDGELLVRSPHGMQEYIGGEGLPQHGWFATGDLVQVDGDRVLFMGRKSETINVGGRKVHPQEVEEIILQVPGVQLVRVYGAENPITGQVVAARIQLLPGYEESDVERKVRQACREAFDRYKRPRLIQFVKSISTANQKVVRR